MIFSDEYYMREAIKEAEQAYVEGEVPIGAVMVYKDKIISKGHNLTEKLCDCTAHAEMMCITAANEILKSKYLHDIDIFITLEPCVMCAGALFWSQIHRLVYACDDKKRGFTNYGILLHHKTIISKGVLKEEAEKMMKNFFIEMRKKY